MYKFLSYFKAVTFCLLHFALKNCFILRQKVVTFRVKKLLHFGLMLHFASKVVTFRVNVTFCVNCYILRRNRVSPFPSLSPRICMLVSYKKKNNVKEAKARIASRYTQRSESAIRRWGFGAWWYRVELLGHSYKKQTTLPIDSQCLI